MIYNAKYYKEHDADKKKRQIQNLPGALIINLRKPRTQQESEADYHMNCHLIMDFLRENYLSNFEKYSRHLIATPRPSSKYYTTHLKRDLEVL